MPTDIKIPLRVCRSFDELTPEMWRQDSDEALADWIELGCPTDQDEIERLLPYKPWHEVTKFRNT